MATRNSRFGWCLLPAALVILLAAPAQAQIPNCGSSYNNTQIRQPEPGHAYVIGTFTTTRNFDGCFYSLRTEGWIDGAGDAYIAEGAFEAIFELGMPVPNFLPRGATGKHFMIQLLPPWEWYLRAITHARTEMIPPSAGENEETPDNTSREIGGGCEANYGKDCAGSPIVLDVDLDGFHLTPPEVLFDIDADGDAEIVSWTAVRDDGTVDAWLACDWNGNGKIDDGSELFGNHTRAYLDRPDLTTRNGFDALNFSQGPTFGSSFPDHQVDERDSIWSRLLLWRDVNHNGISEAMELQPVAESNLKAISFDYKTVGRKDAHGNQFRQRADSWWDVGGKSVKTFVFDVWLAEAGGDARGVKR